MRQSDYDEFASAVRVLAASYETYFGPDQVHAYWVVLESEAFSAVEALCIRLTRGERSAEAKLPTAHSLRRMLRDEHHGSGYELPCQEPGCHALLPWPPKVTGELAYFCPRHRTEHTERASPEDLREMAKGLTPGGLAFLRECFGTDEPAWLKAIPVDGDDAKAATTRTKEPWACS